MKISPMGVFWDAESDSDVKTYNTITKNDENTNAQNYRKYNTKHTNKVLLVPNVEY